MIRHALRRCLTWLSPYRGRTALILAGLALELAFYVSLPLSFRFLIDRAIVPRDARLLTLILGALAGLFVLAAAAGVVKDWALARLVARVLNDLRLAMFDHLQRLSMAFYARASTGDVVARFTTDLAVLELALARALPTLVYTTLQIVISVALLFWLDARLAAITVAALPVCVLGPRLLAARATEAGYRRRQAEAALLSSVQENVGAQAVVRAFGLQETRRARFREQLDTLGHAVARAGHLGSLIGKTSDVGVNLVQLLIIGAGAWLVFGERLEVGALFAFIGTFVNLGLAISNLAQTLPVLLQATTGIRRIDELLEEPVGVCDAADAAPAPRLAREIRLDGVSFSYGGERPTLEQVSLGIRAGHSVAVVGGSGAGKSTILSLITRAYDPQQGAVTLDGVDLRRVTQHSLLAQVGIVSQDTVLFDTTIRENIRMARPGATDAEVEAAARAAEIHDLIVTLPQGYDTAVGERGGRVSTGQRQRLALARAILREPALLILDEATSALDPGTEAAIQLTLSRLRRGRTVISVTHRLAGAVDADEIIVLERGRLAERGTHAELLALGGVYHHLWQHQSGFVISEDGQRAEVEARRLAAIPVFAKLDESHLAAIADRFVTERYPAGKRIIEEGDPGDKLYIIARGSAAVLRRSAGGEEQRVATLGVGDVVGEIALLDDVPRTATIVTLTPCLMLTLGRQAFAHILAAVPGLRMAFEEVAAAHRRETADAGDATIRDRRQP